MKCVWHLQEYEERKDEKEVFIGWTDIECPHILEADAFDIAEDKRLKHVCGLCLKARLVNSLNRIREEGLNMYPPRKAE